MMLQHEHPSLDELDSALCMQLLSYGQARHSTVHCEAKPGRGRQTGTVAAQSMTYVALKAKPTPLPCADHSLPNDVHAWLIG